MNDVVAKARHALKAAAKALPDMTSDVEFFGVTDAEWDAILSRALAAAYLDCANIASDYADRAYSVGHSMAKSRTGRDKAKASEKAGREISAAIMARVTKESGDE